MTISRILSLVSYVFCAVSMLALWGISVFSQPLRPQEYSSRFQPSSTFTETVSFTHLTAPSMLQSVVYSIMQDSRGFMWFGTKDGLYRFDGIRTLGFLNNPLDSTSISDNRILDIYEDHDGDLWIATQDGGLNRFNRTQATFTRYQPDSRSKTAIRSNRVAFAYQDRSKRIWVASEGGLHIFDKVKQTFTVFNANPNIKGALPSNYVRSVLERKNGELWFGTVGGGVCRWNPESSTFTTFKHDKSNPQTIPDNTIHSMVEDSQGTLWLGTTRGLSAFHPETGKSENFFNNPTNTRSLSENIIWDLLWSRDGKLWIATQNGLNLFCPETQDFMRFMGNETTNNEQSLPIGYLNVLYEDSHGRLWIGMYGGGISIIDPFKRKFSTIRRSFGRNAANSSQMLPDNNIWAAIQAKSGNIWLGTVHGLAECNLQTRALKSFHADTLKYGTMTDNFNHLACDSAGRIWCSTYGGGVNVFDTLRHRFVEHYGFDEGNPRSLPTDRVTVIYNDKTNHIWVGTIMGLCRFQAKTRDFEPMFTGEHNTSRLTHPTIKYFLEDSKGRFWIGTAGGLNIVNTQNGTVTKFKSIGRDTTTLTHNNIRQIVEDSQHRIWVATSGGLNLVMEPSSGKLEDIRFRRMTTAHGLPSNLISGVVEDSDGIIWIAHSIGICSFDPLQFRVLREYDASDGLQGQEFRATAIVNIRVPKHMPTSAFSDGMILCAGSNGINYFHPDSLGIDSARPRIVFTDFKTFNQSRQLPINISEAKEITLSHKDYLFSIEFAALDFTNTGKTRYAYKMEGLDKDWVESGEQRMATYTNLSGGEYVFRVKACNHDGIWNEEGISLKITIIPPFWETWWFRSLAVCALAGGIMLGVRMRVRGVQRQNTLLENKVKERTAALQASNHQLSEAIEQLRLANVEKNEFLGIVAHDLKNPLSTIQLAAKLMREEAPSLAVEDFREITGDILTTSNRMFDLITNLLDVNRLEQNAIRFASVSFDIVPLLHASANTYEAAAAAKGLRLHLDTPDQLRAFADESATVQVIDNIVSNAVKYSPLGKNIFISARASTFENGVQIVQIAVRDEGPGLSEEDLKKLFGKFARLSAQPTAGEHSTGLGLSIVKKIVEAMNGRVYCESSLGNGATFVVELPADTSNSQ